MTNLVFRHIPEELPEPRADIMPVFLYGPRPPGPGYGSIGNPVNNEIRRLGVRVPTRAFDFLTVAMAVTAADTFVNRDGPEGDGWCRQLHMDLPLADPRPWQDVVPSLERALHFLSGDLWTISLRRDGPTPPPPVQQGRTIRLAGHDCISLFSGGLDSTIGVLDLIHGDRSPFLVSHSYTRDAQRQELVARALTTRPSRFAAIAHPVSKFGTAGDVQMRSRSFNFLAYGTLVAATLVDRGMLPGPATLYVPENGLIALNPPLTPRRIGSLSTRTTHPHFLGQIQAILDHLGLPVRIVNRYEHKTKGEMIRECLGGDTLAAISSQTVSCGKWKRRGIQCGKCVPCLIRRAAFHSCEMQDDTPYSEDGTNLRTAFEMEKGRDDLLAMILAARRMGRTNMERWITQAGPLPADRTARNSLVDVAERGMAEVGAYLDHLGMLQ